MLDGDPWRDSVRPHRCVAYVLGDLSLWAKLTGGEIIDPAATNPTTMIAMPTCSAAFAATTTAFAATN